MCVFGAGCLFVSHANGAKKAQSKESKWMEENGNVQNLTNSNKIFLKPMQTPPQCNRNVGCGMDANAWEIFVFLSCAPK